MLTALDTLQLLLARYNEMLTLAEANDWDALAAMGKECERLRAGLQTAGNFLDQASPDDLPLLQESLEAILALDARIREHTVPCLESTRQLLSGAVRDRNVRKAYAASGS
jgi:hypothetical protein